MKLRADFFITADTHFGHDKYRPLNADRLIVKNWNAVVGKDDKVLHLGDLSMLNKQKTQEVTAFLNGTKFLIRGNHDGQSETWFKDCWFETVEAIYKRFKDKYENYITVLFTHEPVADLPDGWYNIHGHLHGDKHRDIEVTDRHFDAGVDTNNFTPYRLYDILEKLWDYERKK